MGTPRRSSRHEQTLEPLTLPEELDIDLLGEFPGLKLESANDSVLTKEEEDTTDNELEFFRKTPDPVRIFDTITTSDKNKPRTAYRARLVWLN